MPTNEEIKAIAKAIEELHDNQASADAEHAKDFAVARKDQSKVPDYIRKTNEYTKGTNDRLKSYEDLLTALDK